MAVAVAAATVAHIDLTVASGTFAFRPALPWTSGTEGSGRVPAFDRFAPGKPVRVRGEGVGLDRDGLRAHKSQREGWASIGIRLPSGCARRTADGEA